MPDEPVSNSGRKVILEYVGDAVDGKIERIYGIGMLHKNGKVEREGDRTFPYLPFQQGPVMKADGTVVSYDDYCAELGITFEDDSAAAQINAAEGPRTSDEPPPGNS